MSSPPDRAAVAATAIMQIIATAPKDLRRVIEDYLRDEFSDCAREVMTGVTDLTREWAKGGAANK